MLSLSKLISESFSLRIASSSATPESEGEGVWWGSSSSVIEPLTEPPARESPILVPVTDADLSSTILEVALPAPIRLRFDTDLVCPAVTVPTLKSNLDILACLWSNYFAETYRQTRAFRHLFNDSLFNIVLLFARSDQ